MAITLVQFRTEDTEKIKAVQILDRLGLSLSSYLRMCVSRLNQENAKNLHDLSKSNIVSTTCQKAKVVPQPSVRAGPR